MSDETPDPEPLPPTERLASVPPAAPAAPPTGRGRGPLVAIIVLLVLVLVAAGVIVAILLAGRQPTATIGAPAASSAAPTPTLDELPPSPSPTPSASDDDNGATENQPQPITTPKAARPAAPKPTPTADDQLAFTSFSIPNATCASDQSGTSAVTITYSSKNATAAYFGINVGNAKDAPTDGPLPANGPYTFDFQCSNPQQTWVITIVNASGDSITKKASVAYSDAQ